MKSSFPALCVLTVALVACQQSGPAYLPSGVPLPADLSRAEAEALALGLLSDPELSEAGWQLAERRGDRVRLRRPSSRGDVVVDVYFTGGRLRPVAVNGSDRELGGKLEPTVPPLLLELEEHLRRRIAEQQRPDGTEIAESRTIG